MIFSCSNSDKNHYYSRLGEFSPFSGNTKHRHEAEFFPQNPFAQLSGASPTKGEALSAEQLCSPFRGKVCSCVILVKNNKKPTHPLIEKTPHKNSHKTQIDSFEFVPKPMSLLNLLCCLGTKSQNVLHLCHSQCFWELSLTHWGTLGFLNAE